MGYAFSSIMTKRLLSGVILAAFVACRAPNATPEAREAATPTAIVDAGSAVEAATPSTTASVRDASTGPPPVARACTRDDECAVARIEASGRFVCCGACGTTPGTRAWHAELQLFCGARPTADCPALACPMGPTRAVCRAGICEATADGVDGGPTFVLGERRCLPAMICGAWAGCALVDGNAQDGWYVADATAAPRGTLAAVEPDACVPRAPGRCAAARLFPKGVGCPPTSVPPLISPPPKACVLDGLRCHPAP